MSLIFEVDGKDGHARAGRIRSVHGTYETPAFMPVGTAATVKGMTTQALSECGVQIVLANTYHLMLRPGLQTIEGLGGIGKMMSWPGPVLTDSGGYQIMSLAKLRKLTEEGVKFQSHLDGTSYLLSPEKSIDLQNAFNSTITMVLDECTPFPATYKDVENSMRLSMRWAQRSKNQYVARPGYGIFGIVQGGMYMELRSESVKTLIETDFDGYAIGGLAVGEGPELMHKMVEFTAKLLPEDKPRYLMGVGRPSDLVTAVANGCDMFDCVLPTRSGRYGQCFTRFGIVNLRNSRHKDDPRPLDLNCFCSTCRGYSRAYLHHLIRAKEMLGGILLTWHNLHYYQKLMSELRVAIRRNIINDYQETFYYQQREGDIDPL